MRFVFISGLTLLKSHKIVLDEIEEARNHRLGILIRFNTLENRFALRVAFDCLVHYTLRNQYFLGFGKGKFLSILLDVKSSVDITSHIFTDLSVVCIKQLGSDTTEELLYRNTLCGVDLVYPLSVLFDHFRDILYLVLEVILKNLKLTTLAIPKGIKILTDAYRALVIEFFELNDLTL